MCSTLIYDLYRPASANCFHTINERTVRQHIIAFRLHYYREVAIPDEVKEDASLSFGCREQGMEVVDSLLRGGLQRYLYTQSLGQFHLRVVERHDLIDGEFRVCAFFN